MKLNGIIPQLLMLKMIKMYKDMSVMFKNHIHIENMQLDLNNNISNKSPSKITKKMLMKSSSTINNKSPNNDKKLTSNNKNKTKFNKKSPVNKYNKPPTTSKSKEKIDKK